MNMNLSKLQVTVKDREAGMLQPMGSQRVRRYLVTEQQYGFHKKVLNHPHMITLQIAPFFDC